MSKECCMLGSVRKGTLSANCRTMYTLFHVKNHAVILTPRFGRYLGSTAKKKKYLKMYFIFSSML